MITRTKRGGPRSERWVGQPVLEVSGWNFEHTISELDRLSSRAVLLVLQPHRITTLLLLQPQSHFGYESSACEWKVEERFGTETMTIMMTMTMTMMMATLRTMNGKLMPLVGGLCALFKPR